MKFKLTFIALITYSLGFSQDLNPTAVVQSMSQGMQPGIEIFIPNVSDDNLEDAIKEVTKPYKGKLRKVKSSKETFIDDATIKEISDNTIDIHQIMLKKDNGYQYTVFFNLGGVFLDNAYSAEKFSVATNIVKKNSDESFRIKD